jgi:hypothetical protein
MSTKLRLIPALATLALLAPAFSSQAQQITISSTIPNEVPGGLDATPTQMYTFAWEEFVAANWPAKPRDGKPVDETKPPWKFGSPTTAFVRGQPSSAAFGSTGANGTVVWTTFKEKSEIFGKKLAEIQKASSYKPPTPPPDNPGVNQLPPFDSGIGYGYAFPPSPGNPSASLAWFNNLEEGNEIKLADMYFMPFTKAAATLPIAPLVYEAKQNQTLYDYIRVNGLQHDGVREAALRRTIELLTGSRALGLTGSKSPYKLPMYISNPPGSIEVKATWRFYGGANEPSPDALKRYYHRPAIYYTTNNQGNTVYQNATMLLIGLHIIQKTPQAQTFTFATFEHVDNEANGFVFQNTTASPLPHGYVPQGLRAAIRQHTIPPELQQFNAAVQKQLKAQFGNDIVWANYQLTGIQVKPTNRPIDSDPDSAAFQQYFVANLATETNSALQYFQGLANLNPSGGYPTPGTPNTYQPKEGGGFTPFSMGGCMGCHGVAQTMGGDFSFLIAKGTGNAVSPDPLVPYPGGPVLPQNATDIKDSTGTVIVFPITKQPSTGGPPN